MKVIFGILLSLNFLVSSGQSASNSSHVNFSGLDRSFSSAAISSANATIQLNKWRQQTQLQPEDATAWLNYYNWQDREKSGTTGDKKEALQHIFKSAERSIAGTWQYSLMTFLKSGKRDSSALFDAVTRSDEKATLYPYVVQYALIRENKFLLAQYCEDVNRTNPLSPLMYEYHYNALMSAGQQATIYARGLNDLVPMAVLQQVYGVRKDVHLKYYEGSAAENSYLCLSAGKDELTKYPNAIYTGLLIKLGSEEELKKHYESNLSFARLDATAALSADEAIVYKNYLPAFILLYRMYKKSNDPQLPLLEKRLRKLAQLTATGDKIDQLIAE